MAISKTGKSFVPKPDSFGRNVMKWGLTSPLAAGISAYTVGSGDMSVGETAGSGLGGAAGYFGTQNAISNLAKKMSRSSIPGPKPGGSRLLYKATRYLPKWLKPVGMVAAGLGGSMLAGSAGRRIGSKVPIWQRDKPEAPAGRITPAKQESPAVYQGSYPGMGGRSSEYNF